MQNYELATVDRIRLQSRRLVRELGFMEQSLAGTGLTASAVHALIEIGQNQSQTAQALSRALLLEKSTISRLLKSLIKQNMIVEKASAEDGRRKQLYLTENGQKMLVEIDQFGRGQVCHALDTAGTSIVNLVERGMLLYADALQSYREGTQASVIGENLVRPVITQGYTPGLLGSIVQMHASYYSKKVSFGLEFENLVACEMAEFLTRRNHAANATWVLRNNATVVGGISVDGQDLGNDIGHIRWFIIDDTMRSRGFGNKLMDAAMGFVYKQGFREAHLWTFDGLKAARALYEKHGFVLTDERLGQKWGKDVLEQKFVFTAS